MRGEHGWLLCVGGVCVGSSPHARGTLYFLFIFFWCCVWLGIIPACAGNTRFGSLKSILIGDHPRMRGEHRIDGPVVNPQVGSSPHARGTLAGATADKTVTGIIPACAGNTRRWCSLICLPGDHPRMRGEHTRRRTWKPSTGGSSPHARGTLDTLIENCGNRGIIPACAGNTIHAYADDPVRQGIIPACAGNTEGRIRF